MEIKNTEGEFIFQTDADNFKDAVEKAVECVANLRGADLGGSDLRGANLRGANLGGADLSDADLRGAYLRGANLSVANLRGAKLGGADLIGANLIGANLGGANLGGANLGVADLGGAYLRDANLGGANLGGANLRDADLRGANLGGAYLRCADLGGANLRGANLSDANLRGAYLRGAKNIPFIPIACPTDGEFTGWKKVHGKLIELRITADAKRSSATTEKCRCDKALVIAITDIETGSALTEFVNFNYAPTVYRVGEMVIPDSFDENRWIECGHGIHFFVDKASAINY